MRSITILISIAVIIILQSCSKEDKVVDLTSLKCVNAVIGGGNIKLNSNERDSARAYNYRLFTIRSGSTNVKLFPTNNPSVSYFKGIINCEPNDAYTIFVAGQSPNVDNVLIKENFPTAYTDSSVGVRIINLSPNTTGVGITLQSAPSFNLFTGIVYKQITDFVKLPAATIIPSGSLSFQLRSNSGALLATYTLPATVNSTYPGVSIPLARFKTLTLVVKGLTGGTGADAIGLFPIPSYL